MFGSNGFLMCEVIKFFTERALEKYVEGIVVARDLVSSSRVYVHVQRVVGQLCESLGNESQCFHPQSGCGVFHFESVSEKNCGVAFECTQRCCGTSQVNYTWLVHTT